MRHPVPNSSNVDIPFSRFGDGLGITGRPVVANCPGSGPTARGDTPPPGVRTSFPPRSVHGVTPSQVANVRGGPASSPGVSAGPAQGGRVSPTTYPQVLWIVALAGLARRPLLALRWPGSSGVAPRRRTQTNCQSVPVGSELAFDSDPDRYWSSGGDQVSLAEVMPSYRDGSSQVSDRTPPQDMEAEQCVLGAMLMSKDAIADVVETIRGADFYRPAHEQIYNAVTDLYGRGEPADAVTVADELGKRGELLRLGGAPYLHTLLASVPIAANAGWYAEIVREKAVLRRLVDASVRIGQMSFAGEGDVDDIVDRAQAEVYAVTDRRAAEDFKPLSELMQPTLDEMEAIESRGAGLSGVPTGFADLDELTNGLHPGQMVIIAARPGVGKALALDTPQPTPTGWTTMGEVQVGDELLGSDGRPTRVVAATDVLTDRPCFEVTFSDGTSVI